MNIAQKALHDLCISQAEEATNPIQKAINYEAAALLSRDSAEWDLAASYFWQAGKRQKAAFCEQQANRGKQ